MGISELDPTIYNIIKNEEKRQKKTLSLISTENYTSQSVFQALASPLQNKYIKGMSTDRYYLGCKYIDEMEDLTQQRALELYDLDPEKWGVNVQSYSGAMTNHYVFQGVLEKGARIVGLGQIYGGHYNRGFQIPKHMSFTQDLWEWMHYNYDHTTGLFNYDENFVIPDMNHESIISGFTKELDLSGGKSLKEIQEILRIYRPQMLVYGYSMYPRNYDYKRVKEIADSVDA